MDLIEAAPQDDLPPGRTLLCTECGTRVRDGQPHTAMRPRPHATLGALIRVESLEDADWGRPLLLNLS